VRQIRLIRKYASVLDGFDLSRRTVGDVFHVNDDVADMLAREGWAEPVTSDSGDAPMDEPSNLEAQTNATRRSSR